MSISTVSLSAVVVLTILDAGDKIFLAVAPPMLTIALMMPMTGYVLGYILSALFRLTKA